ncbi:MAG: trypsin-like peptidase domain-containing protein [FCB group bacterium]|nr:trypsin-like peptidase domain-containing protein [FCB group bacterium]
MKVYYTAYYRAYFFPKAINLTEISFKQDQWKSLATETTVYNQSAFSTATIIYYDLKRVAFLTCAHVSDFPDTLITYYQAPEENIPAAIRSVAIKKRFRFFVNDLFRDSDLDVLKMDIDRDLVLLVKDVKEEPRKNIPVFRYPMGTADKLELGSFVYMIGFPIGKKMITTGVVSPIEERNGEEFLVDALFNFGFSGGVILAVRDGVPNFELVGIASSVSANTQYIVVPSPPTETRPYSLQDPYTGDVFVRAHRQMNYGVTYTISIETIRRFFKENEPEFLEAGYDFRKLFD